MNYNGMINHKKYNFDDDLKQNLRGHFDETNAFIEKALAQGNVLVHCVAGASRSASVVIAYMMKNMGYDYNKAVTYCKNIRWQVSPNDNFVR